MQERLSSATILISLALCANSALSATETTNLRFRVLDNPSFERLTVKHPPSVPHQSMLTCERAPWFGAPIPNFSNLEQYMPSHRSMAITHLRFPGMPKHPIYRNRPTSINTNNFVGRINGPSPTPYLESVDRFVLLLKERLKLIESTGGTVSCNGVTS